jgi:hypothetical protein
LAIKQTELGHETDEYKAWKIGADAWYNSAKWSIETMHFGWDSEATGPAGLARRPTFRSLINEFLQIGLSGTPQNDLGRQVDYGLTQAIERIAREWRANDKFSIQRGSEHSWWNRSSPDTSGEAAAMRAHFERTVYAITESIDNEETKQKLQWYVDYMITPLMVDRSPDDPFIIDVEPLLGGS